MQGRGQGLCKERCGLKTKGKGLGGEGGTGVTILKWDELVLLEKQQGQGDLSSVGWSRGECGFAMSLLVTNTGLW